MSRLVSIDAMNKISYFLTYHSSLFYISKLFFVTVILYFLHSFSFSPCRRFVFQTEISGKYIVLVLTPASHMEVGCPGTWGLELLTPNPGSKSTPKACPTHNPATSPARHTQPQPKHLSRRARSSVEIIITIIITPCQITRQVSNNNNHLY